MLPLISPHDKVTIIPVKKYLVDDIVAFKKEDKLIVHRIIYIPKNNSYVITKGDANGKCDGKILKTNLLGKVTHVVKNGEKITLRHIYLTQSTQYLSAYKQLTYTLNKNNVVYTILKGVPIHLYYEGKIPGRLFFDMDIFLRKPEDIEMVIDIFQSLGYLYNAKEAEKSKIVPSEVSFTLPSKPFAITFDVHVNVVRRFRLIGFPNKFLPNSQNISNYLLKNTTNIRIGGITYPILNRESLFVYLLLHFSQHNYQGIFRLNLISNLMSGNLNFPSVAASIGKLGLAGYTYPAILMLQKYYGYVPKSFLQSVKPNTIQLIIGTLISKLVNPFDSESKTVNSLKRLLYVILLSPSFSFSES
jgi:hypothetical protein